jgi:uncharacterized protein YdaU (DUF1376 family)
MMTLEEEGAYRRALDFCWLNGSLPRDPEKLARVIGKGCSVEVANTVQQMFIIDKKNPEQILHERLEIERKKQRLFSAGKSKAGTASGISRRKKKQLSPEQVFDSVDISFERNANETRTKTNSSSSSSSSSPELKSSSSNQSQSTRVSGAVDDDDFLKKKNGNGAKSRFDKSTCSEFVDHLVSIGRPVKNPGGLACSIYATGDNDGEIQAWLDSGKGRKPKTVITMPDPAIKAAMDQRRIAEQKRQERKAN